LERLVRLAAVVAGVARARKEARRDDDVVTPPPPLGDDGVDPRRREVPSDPRAELVVAAALIATGACAVAFALTIATGGGTQLQGLTGGLALAFLALALGVAGKRVVPQEIAVEERPRLDRPEEHEPLRREIASAGEGVSRRRLIAGSAAVAGAGLAAALVTPATSLGPAIDRRPHETPWRRGRRLVDEEDRVLTADDIVDGSFITAFPEGADKRELGSPVVVVRVDPATLQLPAGRAGWAPEGLVAYSKICTHAGCAIALFRSPKFEPVQQRPALACPCHYSAFDVRRGAKVIEGPAGRPLPQLPLMLSGPGRELHAGGGLSGPVGPSWWSVRRS
jgi:ubiquinol-cytochrome c reductase iron-sulfur subunit